MEPVVESKVKFQTTWGARVWNSQRQRHLVKLGLIVLMVRQVKSAKVHAEHQPARRQRRFGLFLI
jgi:hypothetical protein